VPALLIHGGQDGCIGREIFAAQEHLFASSLKTVCFERSGHFMQVEEPEHFAETLLGFLRGLKA